MWWLVIIGIFCFFFIVFCAVNVGIELKNKKVCKKDIWNGITGFLTILLVIIVILIIKKA